jgi:hypothetical protein
LRARGSSQEGILISSESSMDFDEGAEGFVANGGAGVVVFTGFAVSNVPELGTFDVEDGVALTEAGEEFVEPDCGADA